MSEKYEKPSALAVYATGVEEVSTAYRNEKIDEMVAADCGGACKCPSPSPCACRC